MFVNRRSFFEAVTHPTLHEHVRILLSDVSVRKIKQMRPRLPASKNVTQYRKLLRQTRRKQALLFPRVILPLNRRLFAANCSLCDRDTGYSTITDVRGQAHLVFISRTRDGGVWLRLGVDQKSSQWASRSEYRQQLQDTLLSDRDMNVIENMNFSSACVVTDLRLEIRMEFGWHPSFVPRL